MPTTVTSENLVLTASALTSNGTLTVPAGYAIQGVYIVNTTANAITGGLRIGTTDGGADVVLAMAVGANLVGSVFDAALLKRLFSTSVDTVLYLQAVVLWNSASLNVRIPLTKVF